MSVVACKKYIRETDSKEVIEFSADSILVRGQTQEKRSKLEEINSMIIGGAGNAKDLSLFFSYCSTRKPEDETEIAIIRFYVDFLEWRKKIYDSVVSLYFLIFTGTKIFMCEDGYIREIEDYNAIGAGMDYAMAALWLGHTTEESVGVACDLCTYCERPIKTITKVICRR